MSQNFTFMKKIYNIIVFLFLCFSLQAQTVLKGLIKDSKTGEPLIGANIVVKGVEKQGSQTDADGNFELRTTMSAPITLVFSYLGYQNKEIVVSNIKERVSVSLIEDSFVIADVIATASRISDKVKESALTIESLDSKAMKQTASSSFFEGLGALKGVDLTTASLGFTIINMRGFNSTSPVRSLQIIDGIDNQSPGLNFSLGNFLGASELDVNKVNLVVGASSSFYGPNAFNGVISMETKNPFIHKGVSVSQKIGERNLYEGAIRLAGSLKNKAGHDFFAAKVNFFYLKAYDWVADNYDPITGSDVDKTNPGGYDAVNIYGDEYSSATDQTKSPLFSNYAGLGQYHRTGYKEIDLVDYNTKNLKASTAFHLRTKPSKGVESPELIYSFNLGSGTTVYQGDNRFSLRNILFWQNRLEFRKADKFFIRAYTTQEDAGDSYDPYFTSLLLLNKSKSAGGWNSDYLYLWDSKIRPKMLENGYPKSVFNQETFKIEIDSVKAVKWLADNGEFLTKSHAEAKEFADNSTTTSTGGKGFYKPGTPEFQSNLDAIRNKKSSKVLSDTSGTRLIDYSALFHLHGEYTFEPTWTEKLTVGANYRRYAPNTEGTIFNDTAGTRIVNNEFGIYSGIEKKFFNNRLKTNAALRMDKNQNFGFLFSPAVSGVYEVNKKSWLRLSFSSAIRNPTLSDQYLYFNVGRAILAGNINGVQDLITVESFVDYVRNLDVKKLQYFNIAAIKPEKVKSFEIGYKTAIDKVYIDGSYYYSFYNDFLGYNIGVKAKINQNGFPEDIQAFRYAANSINQVTTQGFSVGVNYEFRPKFMLAGNYSWNKLNKDFADDPIIPAFNTPRNKYNLSISGFDLKVGSKAAMGFNVNYKWIQGFTFEGSPQFTGFIPTYDLVDAQVNLRIPKLNTTFKLGASNILNNKQFQTYGGPRIGRMGYFSIVYDYVK